MIGLVANEKIIIPIIASIAVYVMDYLVTRKTAAYCSFSNQTMLMYIAN